MEYRRLGRTGVKVSAISLGCMTFGGQVDHETSQDIISRAIDEGINLFDTADVYTGGRSEEILGRTLKGSRRDKVMVATKVRGRTGDGPNDEGLSRAHLVESLEQSLRRLQSDYVDFYQIHFPDPMTPLDETLRALDDLVRQGKVRYLGCSNFRAWQTCKALWMADSMHLNPMVCVQPRYSLLYRAIERELLPFCVEEGLGVLAYSPLAGGLLTGKYQRGTPPPPGTRATLNPYFARALSDRNFDSIERLQHLADQWDRRLSHIALGWLLRNRSISSAIIGATTLDQFEEDMATLNLSLTNDQLREIDAMVGESDRSSETTPDGL